MHLHTELSRTVAKVRDTLPLLPASDGSSLPAWLVPFASAEAEAKGERGGTEEGEAALEGTLQKLLPVLEDP